MEIYPEFANTCAQNKWGKKIQCIASFFWELWEIIGFNCDQNLDQEQMSKISSGRKKIHHFELKYFILVKPSFLTFAVYIIYLVIAVLSYLFVRTSQYKHVVYPIKIS